MAANKAESLKLIPVILALLAAALMLALVAHMAKQMEAEDLTPRAYLPLVRKGHQVRAALSQTENVSCEKVQFYGAEWVSSWWPNCGMCGELPMRPMIRPWHNWSPVAMRYVSGSLRWAGSSGIPSNKRSKNEGVIICSHYWPSVTMTNDVSTSTGTALRTVRGILCRWRWMGN